MNKRQKTVPCVPGKKSNHAAIAPNKDLPSLHRPFRAFAQVKVAVNGRRAAESQLPLSDEVWGLIFDYFAANNPEICKLSIARLVGNSLQFVELKACSCYFLSTEGWPACENGSRLFWKIERQNHGYTREWLREKYDDERMEELANKAAKAFHLPVDPTCRLYELKTPSEAKGRRALSLVTKKDAGPHVLESITCGLCGFHSMTADELNQNALEAAEHDKGATELAISCVSSERAISALGSLVEKFTDAMEVLKLAQEQGAVNSESEWHDAHVVLQGVISSSAAFDSVLGELNSSVESAGAYVRHETVGSGAYFPRGHKNHCAKCPAEICKKCSDSFYEQWRNYPGSPKSLLCYSCIQGHTHPSRTPSYYGNPPSPSPYREAWRAPDSEWDDDI